MKLKFSGIACLFILHCALLCTQAQAELNIITYNVWGIPFAPKRAERILQLCAHLKKITNLDLIMLQEVWLQKDRDTLKNCGYRYSIDRDYGEFDSGLLILSKYKPTNVERIVYKNHGERVVRKSLLLARIEHPKHGSVWIANTHLVANYYKKDFTYYEVRRTQLLEAMKELNSLDGKVIFAGDLNLSPNGIAYEDNWNLLLSKLFEFKTLSNENSPYTFTGEGRLDHIFVKGLNPLKEKLVFSQPNETYSDHFGIQTVFN